MIEEKGYHKVDDQVVLAKAKYAQELATANKMQYEMAKGSEVKSYNLE